MPLDDVQAPPKVRAQIAAKLANDFFFIPRRYKVAYGGRGGAKSWSFARALIAIAHTRKVLILCTREFQNSIADSVLRLLASQIEAMGLGAWFDIQKATIISKSTGSEFIFKGLRHNVQEIKSTEGVDICWVAEAQSCSEDSWQTLIPTIRSRPGAPPTEIWIDFNPVESTDPTYKRFVLNPPPPSDCISIKIGWQDNPWFPPELEKERRYMMRVDPDAYDWIWEGFTRKISEASILRGRYSIESFETPDDIDRMFFGADWGFANDPSVLVRFFIRDECLFIDHEAYGIGVEIDDLPAMFEGGIAAKSGIEYAGIPDVKQWPIKADSARPETISYISRRGFNIAPAEKWKGCVEDGIAHIKGFKQIIIHERCTRTAQEARLYSYKTDKKTNEILPIIEDKHNHCIDAIRYGLDGYIQHRGGLGVWSAL